MMEFPSTPMEILEKYYNVARMEGLKYVYIENVPAHKLEHRYCHECGMILVQRYGFDIISWYLDKKNRCRSFLC
jgi:pyruvate formate lyase activating enzyme